MTTKSNSLRTAEVIHAIDQPFRYVYTMGGFKICPKCCKKERKKFALDPLWLVKTDVVNKSNKFLTCDNCGQPIMMLASFR